MTELTPETLPDAGAEPLDPALLRAIRPSASRMASAEEAFVRLLHEEIESLVSQLPDKGWPLCERTARAILWLVLSDPPAEAVAHSLRWLSEANQADGFPAPEYVSIGHALVRIAREISGTKWTTTTGSAWIRFFMWLQPHLQGGTARPAGRPEAPRREAPRRQAPPETAPQQVIIPGQEAPWRHADADVASGFTGLTSAGDGPAPVDQGVLGGTAPQRDE